MRENVTKRAMTLWSESIPRAPELKESSRILQMVDGIEKVAEAAEFGKSLADMALNKDQTTRKTEQLRALVDYALEIIAREEETK